MKKSLIFLSICSAALLSSCGTSSYYASSAFEDGIYYRPDKESRQQLAEDRQEMQDLIEKTRQEAARFSDTIMLASINGTNSITSAATANAVPVNINVDNWYEYNLLGYDTYCSYWDWRYWDMFGPWGRYSSWADWYNWYSPWFPGIYDPWYPSYGWRWSFAWNSWGWYGPWWGGYWGGWYAPWYGPWGYPVASSQPTYHGKRTTGTGMRTGLTGGGRTIAAGTVRGTGSINRDLPGTSRQPAVSVVRGRTATTRPSASTTGYRASAGRTYTATKVNLGERYVSSGAAVKGRTANIGRLNSGSTFRRPASSTDAGFRSPFESSRTAVNSRYSSGYNRNTATVGRSTEYRRNNNSVFNRSNTNNSSRSFNSGSTRNVSRSSFTSGGSRSYSGGGSRSGGGSVRR